MPTTASSICFTKGKGTLNDDDFYKRMFGYAGDPKSDILYLNRISESQTLLHTFLADRDNRIVLIGSPVGNPKLSELYRRQLRELSGE